MDPLSITASVVGISGACAAVIKISKDLLDRYNGSDLTIQAICTESATVMVALSRIERLARGEAEGLVSRSEEHSILRDTFDASLTGCTMLYSALYTDMQTLEAALNRDGGLDWKHKLKPVWKEDSMKDYLQQIRGQAGGLTLLLSSLQT